MKEQLIIAIVCVIVGWILGNLPIIIKTIKAKIQAIKNLPKEEENAVIVSSFPIKRSPKGYMYYIDDPKRTPHCGNCSPVPVLNPLKRIKNKLVCPNCKAVYKV